MRQTVSQSKVDTLITNFVIKGMHSLSIAEQPEFKELVTGLNSDATVMARRTLGRRIGDAVENRMKAIKEELSEQRFVCTTADVWSTKHRSYMGVTCHWIDASTFERRSVALACRRFVGSHTCDGVAQLIYVIHNELGLTHDKIVATISDNGSNFVKAFKEFSVAIVHSRDTIVMMIQSINQFNLLFPTKRDNITNINN